MKLRIVILAVIGILNTGELSGAPPHAAEIPNEEAVLPLDDISLPEVHKIVSAEYKQNAIADLLPPSLHQPLEQAITNVFHFAFHGDPESCMGMHSNMMLFCHDRVINLKAKISPEALKVYAGAIPGIPFQRMGFPDSPLTVKTEKLADVFPDLVAAEGSQLAAGRTKDVLIFVTVWTAEKTTPTDEFPQLYRCSSWTFVCDPHAPIPAFYLPREKSYNLRQPPEIELPLFLRRNGIQVPK